MSLGSFLRGVVAQVNPFDNGATYGTYNPPKRKPQPGDPGYVAPTPAPSVQPSNQVSQNQVPGLNVQQPKNIFDNLNQNLNFNKPNNTLPVVSTPSTQPVKPPVPGTVVQPTVKTPQQHIDDGLNAGKSWEQISRETGVPLQQVQDYSKATRPNYGINPTPSAYKPPNLLQTIGNTITGSVANVPEIGLAALRAGTGLVQGALNIPHDVTALTAGATQQIQKHFNNPVTRQINRGFQDVNTGVKDATHYTVNDALDPINRGLDTASKMYERNVPVAAGGAKVYKAEQVPLNILAALATAGAAPAADAGDAAEAGNASKLTQIKTAISNLLNKPIGAEDNPISSVAQPILNRVRPVAEAANSPIKAVTGLINRLRAGNVVPPGDVGNLLTDAQATDLATTHVPVSTGVNVEAPPSEPVNVPVTNANTPGNLIQEVGGDAKTATTNADATAKAVNVRRVEASKNADTVVNPDRSIEGVKPYSSSPATTTSSEVQAERDALDKALANKEITKTAHTAANKALDETPVAGEVPKGNPIAVKEVKGIDVNDQTNVPQNLPETPGKVRVTASTEPTLAKSEAVAAESTPPPAIATDNAALPRNSDGTTKLPGDSASAPTTPDKTLPAPNESDEAFLKRTASDMQDNIKRAVTSLKATKQMTKAERTRRAEAGQKAYEEAKAAGLSPGEQEAARKTAYAGGFDRQDYVGTPVHSEDEQRLRDMVDQHYSDMPYQAGNVRDAFTKLFHAGEPGWASEEGNHIIPSDIKNIRKFLNESVPNVDGEGGLGDITGGAIKDLTDTEAGPSKVAKAIGLQRALRFTMGLHATLRQALPAGLSHPEDFAQATKKSFEVMFSGDKYKKYVGELSSSKDANYMADSLGIHIPLISDHAGTQDDLFRNSQWADKIPGVKQVVDASSRQYNALLSGMRVKGGQRFIDAAGGIGNLEKAASDSGDADAFKKAIGAVVDTNTGRGTNATLDQGGAKVLSNLLISPRGLVAKINRFNPKYYTDLMKANPAAGKEALRSLGIQAAVTVSALGAANKAGIYEDGKIKVGNTRYDLTGGAGGIIKSAVKIVQYMTGDRATTPFNNAPDEVTNWAKNQLAPFLSSALDTIGIHKDPTGTWVNHWGEPVSAESTLFNNLTPVNASQVDTDLRMGTPPGQSVANAALSTGGVGVDTYQTAADKKAQGAAGPSGTPKQNNSIAQKQVQSSAEQTALKTNAGNGYSLQELSDGKYAYTLDGDTAVHTAKTLDEARQAVAKAGFQDEGGSYKIIGNEVYRKDANGKVQNPISKTAFDYKLGAATLTGQKTAGDLTGWLKTADSQISNIQKQLNDPNVDPVDKATLENEEQAIVNDKAKYQAYGGFTKPKGFGAGPKAFNPSFGALKPGSSAPTVQQYATISTKSASVPHISAVLPNIVHNITHG